MATEEKKLWTEEVKIIQEDQCLMSLVDIHGTKKWAMISRILKEQYQIMDKSGKQCRERWNNSLNPKLTDQPWTAQEEKILFEKQEKHGNKWSSIASFLKGRSDNATKNHFYSIVRKNLRRYNKNKRPEERIEGNIQELLEKPEVRKILVKKPRHYHQKSMKKRKIEIITPAAKPCPSVERRKSRSADLNLENIPNRKPFISIRKPSTTLNLNEIQESNQKMKNLVCPTPIHQLYIDDLASNSIYNGLASISTKSSLLQNDGQNFTFFDVSPHPEGKSFFFSRDYTRNLSMKSNDDEFFIRGDSRKSTEKSEGIRSDSRKNSQKEGFERGNNRKDTLPYETFTFPMYSPRKNFDFYNTPKNCRN